MKQSERGPAARKTPRPIPRSLTEGLACAELASGSWLSWVMKRTYRIDARTGRAELDTPQRQEVLCPGEIPYNAKRKSPLRSPPFVTNDQLAFRAQTDVVVQASAYAYKSGVTRLTASVRFGEHLREIAVFGDRVGDFDALGRPRFSDPGPIEVVPVRYDFAYGGVDLRALARHGDPIAAMTMKMRPEDDPLFFTDYHYPRNPCGFGYVMEQDQETWKGLPLPNLEFPADPLTPEKMAVGEPERWIFAPLPAGLDWQSEAWFPRIGYAGMTQVHAPVEEPIAEVKRGWAAKDILDIEPVMRNPEQPMRQEFMQAASPGMTVDGLAPGTEFELRHLHPDLPRYAFRMPDEVPRARIELFPGETTDLAPHLDSVVVRPGLGEVVMVWSARTPVRHVYAEEQVMNMKRDVAWVRAEKKG